MQALHSTAIAADRLREQSGEPVKVTCFINGSQSVTSKLAKTAEHLSVELISLQESSNGACLNRQIDQAVHEGFSIFYRADADDFTLPDRFTRQAKCFRKDAGDICGGGLIYRNIRDETEIEVFPKEHPDSLSYLSNSYFLHPVLAFRLEALSSRGIRYWHQRQEDKYLALQAHVAGLRVFNDQALYGRYNLNPDARNSLQACWLTFKLNMRFLQSTRQIRYMPFAIALFLTMLLLPRQILRNLRHKFKF